MTTAPDDPILGRLIDGRYQVRSRIARGGMATVYLATDLRLERQVALKIMHGHLADDANFRNRFVQEARSAARLAHPNVVNVFDQGQDSGMAYLVMEYLPGITLRELLKDYGSLTPEQTVDIMEAVLSGLAAAHAAGIVHRDVKPENVLLADDGRIKLGDFGLARAASANTATGQALLGTIAYLSPELVTRGVADARSDIYAAGIMMYEMLTGSQPYVGEAPMQIAYQHANDQVPAPSSRKPGVPRVLDQLVLWATARDPQQRPADALTMLNRLHDVEETVHPTRVLTPGMSEQERLATTRIISGGQAPAGGTKALPEPQSAAVTSLVRVTQRRRRRGYFWLILVLVLAAVAGGTGWYFGSGPGSYLDIPTVTGMDPAAAKKLLVDQGFAVVDANRYDYRQPAGKVSGTDPDQGQAIPKGSTVTLFSSLGPRILTIPSVVGMSEAAARAKLGDFTVAAAAQQEFSSDVPSGSVIRLLSSDGNPASDSYPEKGTLTLVVSVGPVPDVTGKTVAEAKAVLEAAHLTARVGDPQFSDTVPVDSVISAAPGHDGPVHPGDTIVLTPSKGPDLVEVPNVITGQTIAEARKQLTALGFQVSSNVPEFLEIAVIANTQSPAAGTKAKRGSTIQVNFAPQR